MKSQVSKFDLDAAFCIPRSRKICLTWYFPCFGPTTATKKHVTLANKIESRSTRTFFRECMEVSGRRPMTFYGDVGRHTPLSHGVRKTLRLHIANHTDDPTSGRISNVCKVTCACVPGSDARDEHQYTCNERHTSHNARNTRNWSRSKQSPPA